MSGELQKPTRDFSDDSGKSYDAQWEFELPECPKRIGRYLIEKAIGKGGFGLVYLARDEELNRRVAIKVPHSKLVAEPHDAQAYFQEASTVANLDHPNVVPVYDVGKTEEFPCYIVAKYIEGTNLATMMKAGRVSYRKAAELVATIAEALHYAHKQGLVHRDVKPANILIDTAGKPYVVDFGLALRDENIGKGPRYAGTPAYMSPEQASGEGHRVDGRSDVFSLGVVFYKLLAGRPPFRGDTQVELLEQVKNYEPRPLCQYDETLPKELERICHKAISKRASERFRSAHDLAQDLRHFLEEESATVGSLKSEDETAVEVNDSGSTSSVSSNSSSTASVATSSASMSLGPLIKIVPKGLRSFDEHDADFFLELLPGPRDRNGLPDGLRFWKALIEETDPDKTFSVGLVYGPSGCGKSSLIKAGLMPRLSTDVIPIYVEATLDETEARIMRAVRKQCPGLDDNLSLTEMLTALRRGRGITVGKKVVIILDQFEQWLHAKKEERNSELIQALRHCDGSRLQCIVMVRDDFWLAVSRFFRALEIRLVEGKNSSLVDLFDPEHARKVLAAFGCAFGKLPEKARDIPREQKGFLKQSVEGLAEDGKVICVRLSLFAEMMKGKNWTPAALREVGGTTGVGATFLEETFSATTAPPEHRFHQKASREVLKALLPDSGTDIKGEMKSYEQLLAASGYAGRNRDFDELIRILDTEIRLITPTDPEGADDMEDSVSHIKSGQKYYQLTHDYLVPSLREWLNRKQKETRRGRAELRLGERSKLWNIKRENRHLPSLFEWVNISALTRKNNWTQPQRTMMQKAGRVHGIRGGATLVVILLIGVTIQQIVASVGQRNLTQRVQTSISSLNTSRGIILPPLKELDEFPQEMVLAELRSQFGSEERIRKLALAFALAEMGEVNVDFLIAQIETASPYDLENFVAALNHSRSAALEALEAASRTAEQDQKWRSMARLAMVALNLQAPELAEIVCGPAPDPIKRTWFIEECSSWHGDLSTLARIIATCESPPLRSAVALAVGGAGDADVTSEDKLVWQIVATDWFVNATDALTHSSADWLLRKWNLEVPELTGSDKTGKNHDWQVNSIGMTMLKMPAGNFVRKAGDDGEIEQMVTLTNPFWLADREVTNSQFLQFFRDVDVQSFEESDYWKRLEEDAYSDHPILHVSWYSAVRFCNWLSLQENLRPCYEQTGEKETIDGKEYDSYRLIPQANGYRLPTEAEWEYACRAGSVTDFHCGDDILLLDRYSNHRSDGTTAVGSKLPSFWGLFDIHGNAWEWCQDWVGIRSYGTDTAVSDPKGLEQSTDRMLRGGTFGDHAATARSEQRHLANPNSYYGSIGLRVARNDH